MGLHRIKFTRAAQVERSHADKTRGGYRVDTIEAGTTMVVNDASLRFWRARDCIEVLERVREQDRRPEPPPPPENPFAIVAPSRKAPTKTSLRRAAMDAIAAIVAVDYADLAKALAVVCDEDFLTLVPDVNPDDILLLRAALEDSERGQLTVNTTELEQALRDVQALTLPPSRR
jgi:hypothetical protein